MTTIRVLDPLRDKDWDGREVPVLEVTDHFLPGLFFGFSSSREPTQAWLVNAVATRGGCLSAMSPTKEEALRRGGRFLLEHGEFDDLLEALLGWLRGPYDSGEFSGAATPPSAGNG
jgi:hypothetical protein